MKPALILATAALLAMVSPAMADNGQVLDLSAHKQAYPAPSDIGYPGDLSRNQCFNGKRISGISRSGPSKIYVQAATGQIFQLKMADDCAALNAATKVTMKVSGNDRVCENAAARMIAHTPDGAKYCKVSEVRRLTPQDVAELSASNRR